MTHMWRASIDAQKDAEVLLSVGLRWVTDAGEKLYRIERFLETARAMMARRNRELEPADETRLRSLAESAS